MEWRRQAAEAIAYIHEKGVLHSDLRPDSLLLYSTEDGMKSLRLCDFGGSVYGKLNDGHLPDADFFDSRKPWESIEQTDIFSLGSVFYTIMVGHWAHRPRDDSDDYIMYINKVDRLFADNIFPPVEHLDGGIIIQGCWNDQYGRAIDIVHDHRRLMGGS